MVEEAYALDGSSTGGGAGAAGAWHTLQHAEQQQAALASALLGTYITLTTLNQDLHKSLHFYRGNNFFKSQTELMNIECSFIFIH